MSKRVLVPYSEPERLPPYMRALLTAGIEPVPVPATSRPSIGTCQGLLLTGGTDLDPALYGEPRESETEPADPELDSAELAALTEALDRDLPVLAICRGLQMLNVHHGGTLIQHLVPPERHRTIKDGDRSLPVHSVVIQPETVLSRIAGNTNTWWVNSRHHQAVKTLGQGLRVSAVHPDDGIVEAIERPDKRFVVAVQWHPEDQVKRDAAQLNLFQSFASMLSV